MSTYFTRPRQLALALTAIVVCAGSASAQQRPLMTEDPEPVGAGRVLIEGGVDFSHNAEYSVVGLEGNLSRWPVLGVSVGVSPVVELQIDGGHDQLSIHRRSSAPLSDLLDVAGDRTHDIEDLVIGTKVRLAPEKAHLPAFGFRFATRLPAASVDSGLGPGTTDFSFSMLSAKTVQSLRVVGNIGALLAADPEMGSRHSRMFIYGLSFARALTDRAEVVGEVNGRVSTDDHPVSPGTETRGTLTLAGRYTRGPIRYDAGLLFGLTTVDPTVGVSAGFTYVFHAFNVP